MAHYFPYGVKLGLLAHSRSFLANQKARNAIVGAEKAENLLMLIMLIDLTDSYLVLHGFKSGKWEREWLVVIRTGD